MGTNKIWNVGKGAKPPGNTMRGEEETKEIGGGCVCH